MNRSAIMAAAAVLPLLAACANQTSLTSSEGQTAPHFGEALQRDMAAQIVHPDAPLSTTPMTMDGQRAALAQENYAKDKVKQPADISIGVGLGSGNSGSSGGGLTQ